MLKIQLILQKIKWIIIYIKKNKAGIASSLKIKIYIKYMLSIR